MTSQFESYVLLSSRGTPAESEYNSAPGHRGVSDFSHSAASDAARCTAFGMAGGGSEPGIDTVYRHRRLPLFHRKVEWSEEPHNLRNCLLRRVQPRLFGAVWFPVQQLRFATAGDHETRCLAIISQEGWFRTMIRVLCVDDHAGFRKMAFRCSARERLILLLMVCVAAAGCRSGTGPKVVPKISFTQVPVSNPGDHDQQDVTEGTVRGAMPGQRIVLYSKAGALWWLQPLLTAPFTAISSSQSWGNETHLGTEYAALLVDPSYHPAAALAKMPEPGGPVSAVAVTRGQEKSSSFFTNFSSFTWRVRWKPSDRGGTNNLYNPDNVYVDHRGALHLQIVNRDQHWTCSEVNLTRSLGYGTYSFTVEDTSNLEPAVVFGMFIWDYSTDQPSNREFDIEMSRWGDPDGQNAQFALQPNYAAANISRFAAPAGTLKHTIVWEPGRITMITSRAVPGEPVVSKHAFTSQVPRPGSESARMTFYVYWNPMGKPAGVHHRAEVIVDRFQFLP